MQINYFDKFLQENWNILQLFALVQCSMLFLHQHVSVKSPFPEGADHCYGGICMLFIVGILFVAQTNSDMYSNINTKTQE